MSLNKFIYQFPDKLNLKTPNNNNIGLDNLSLYYAWKNIKSKYSNNKFKVSAPTWDDIFDLLMVLIQFPTFKIILSLSSKNTKF